jgi:hypothetical protein
MGNLPKILTVAGIGILILLIIGGLGTFVMFKFNLLNLSPVLDSDTLDQLNNESSSSSSSDDYDCTISFSPGQVEAGQTVTGTIEDGKNAICVIYFRFNGGVWMNGGQITTDSDGYYSETRVPEYAGYYEFKAICENCTTDLAGLNVTEKTVNDTEEDEQQQDLTACEDIGLPSYGDLGALCAEGYCDDSSCTCSHYWDYLNQEHLCGCADGYYCGQYCYEYFFGDCECPPNSEVEILTRSTFQCVPTYHTCVDGVPELFPD